MRISKSTQTNTQAGRLLLLLLSWMGGVILTRDGYILTNNHVEQGADHQEVDNAAEARSGGRDAPGPQVLLRVWSQGGSHYVLVNEG